MVIAFFQSNWSAPNLLVKGPHGNYDLTATFANIELNYGSKTVCDEEEAKNIRADKEKLKLECVRWVIAGAEENDNEHRAEYWLLPPFPAYKEGCYTAFSPKVD